MWSLCWKSLLQWRVFVLETFLCSKTFPFSLYITVSTFFDCFFIKAEFLRILFSKAFEILNTKLAGKLKGSLRGELLHSLLHHKSLFTKKAFRTFSEKLKKVFTTQSFDAYLSFESFHKILNIKKQSLCKEIFMTDLNRVILNFSAWICLWW